MGKGEGVRDEQRGKAPPTAERIIVFAASAEAEYIK